VQVPAVHWWYKTASHAAELTAGFYNPTNQDGYAPVFEVLRKHSVTLKFVCLRLQVSGLENDEALADPEGLSWQVMTTFYCLWTSYLLNRLYRCFFWGETLAAFGILPSIAC
jgi:hypothetical protein